MSELSQARRPDRGVLRLHGEDVNAFLQGLITVDIEKCTPTNALYGALLTPQGKFLHDFFLTRDGDGAVLLETEADRLAVLKKKLTLHKLRAKVSIEEVGDSYDVVVLFGNNPADAFDLVDEPGSARALEGGGAAYVDPRLSALGVRVLLPKGSKLPVEAAEGDFDALRLALGVPEGSTDLSVEKAILLENGFDELRGVDWKKGCYMGQELTARTKYRALIRKRLMPFRVDGTAPEAGTALTKNGKAAGAIQSVYGSTGLAMIKLTALEEDGAFLAGETEITVSTPDWISLGDPS